MSRAPTDIARLLDRVMATEPAERRSILESADVRATCVALAEEAGRRVFGEVSTALKATEIVVALVDEFDVPRAQALARRARGQALAYAGRHAEALRACQAGVELAERAGHAADAAFVRLALLHPLGELGRYDEAVDAGEAARVALAQCGQMALAARADINLGGIHLNRDDPGRALFHLDRARNQLSDDPQMLGFIENNRGEALLLLGEFDQARAAFEAARAAAVKSEAKLAAAIAEGNLADLAARQGHLQTALLHFEQARRQLEADTAGSHESRLLAEQAEALVTLGLTLDAMALYEQVIPRLERHGMAWEMARAQAGLGRALLRLGRRSEAQQVLTQAAEGFERLQHGIAKARVDLLRAEIARLDQDYAQARALLESAFAMLRDRPAESGVARRELAHLALACGDTEEAEGQLASAFREVQPLELAPLLSDLLHLRGLLRERQGRFEEAVDDLKAAARQVERIRGSLQADRFRAAYLGNRQQLYEDLVHAECARRDTRSSDDVLDAIERAKSRSLLDLVRGHGDELIEAGQEDAGPDAELRNRLIRLQAELNALYSQLADNRERHTRKVATEVWRPAIRARERELAAIENRLWSVRGVSSLMSPPAQAAALRRLLPERTGVIEYFIARGRVLAVVTDRERTQVAANLAPESDVAELVGQLQFQIARGLRPAALQGPRAGRMTEDCRRELRAIGGLLFEPALSLLGPGIERLVIVPHGPLHCVPFHAVWDGKQYAIERFEMSYSPSASLLVHHLEDQRELGQGAALVVAVSDGHAPEIAVEGRRVAELLRDLTALFDGAATASLVKEIASRARLLHFACHAKYSSSAPLSSGLKLADRWLTVRDILSLRLDADLVTLSGCNTGRNLIIAGDELVGLLRGFLAAGARSLLVSLWALNDRSAAELTARFYTFWRGEGGVWTTRSAALTAAQRAAIRANPHPAYWAPFILVGQP